MSDADYTDLEFTMVGTTGSFRGAGSPNLFCHFRILDVSRANICDARVTLMLRDDRDGSWRNYEQRLQHDLALSIAQMIKGLGFPERKPQVDGVVDTSDVWNHLDMHCRSHDLRLSMHLQMMACGFEGPQAHELKDLFHTLFDAAGYDHSSYAYKNLCE